MERDNLRFPADRRGSRSVLPRLKVAADGASQLSIALGVFPFEIGLASGLNVIIVPPEMMLLEMPLMILLGVLLLVVI